MNSSGEGAGSIGDSKSPRLGQIPSLVPQVAVSLHATVVGNIHAVFHEDLVEEHVHIAVVVRVEFSSTTNT